MSMYSVSSLAWVGHGSHWGGDGRWRRYTSKKCLCPGGTKICWGGGGITNNTDRNRQGRFSVRLIRLRPRGPYSRCVPCLGTHTSSAPPARGPIFVMGPCQGAYTRGGPPDRGPMLLVEPCHGGSYSW